MRNVAISDYLLKFLLLDLPTRSDDFFYLDNGKQERAFLTANDAAQVFRFIQKKHGLYRADIKRWHGFRSRVTTEIAKQMGVVYAQKNAGHSSLKTTQGYIDSDQIDLLESVNILRPKTANNHIKNHIKNLIDFNPGEE
ncbi:MAG: site-specific integrase [SAR324 cluster bacterium]|nr:site-specific integrase [SAR324 cluster bacterium]